MSVNNNINTAQAAAKLRAAVQEATYRAAVSIQTLAVSRTPIEQGELRDSAHVEEQHAGDVARAEVGFNKIYATRQHEETGWNHPRGGQAKYLESALTDGQQKAREIAQNHLRGVLNG